MSRSSDVDTHICKKYLSVQTLRVLKEQGKLSYRHRQMFGGKQPWLVPSRRWPRRAWGRDGCGCQGDHELLSLLVFWIQHVLWLQPRTKSRFSDSSQAPSLCSDSWRPFPASCSQTDHPPQPLLQPNLDSPPNGGSLGLNHILPASSVVSFLFSDGSFINKARRLKLFFCSLFFFNRIKYFHAIYFILFLNTFTLAVIFVVLL